MGVGAEAVIAAPINRNRVLKPSGLFMNFLKHVVVIVTQLATVIADLNARHFTIGNMAITAINRIATGRKFCDITLFKIHKSIRDWSQR